MELLNNIENNEAKTPENRRRAAGLKNNFYKFESCFITIFWTTRLVQIDKTNKVLQAVGINLKDVVSSYISLIDFMTELRTDEMFLNFIEQAKKLEDEDYQPCRIQALS